MSFKIEGSTTPVHYFAGLRQRLAVAGITEGRLAAKAGMTPTQFSRYMRGMMDPLLSTVARLEGAFEKLTAPGK